jgi:hypothetical protein
MPACQPLAPMLDNNQTDNNKVIGGLSTDGLITNFDKTCNESASLDIGQVDSPSLTFKKYQSDYH